MVLHRYLGRACVWGGGQESTRLMTAVASAPLSLDAGLLRCQKGAIAAWPCREATRGERRPPPPFTLRFRAHLQCCVAMAAVQQESMRV